MTERYGLTAASQGRQTAPAIPLVNKDLDGNALGNALPQNINMRLDLNAYVMEVDTAEAAFNDEVELLDDELLITSPSLYAYNLTTKLWCKSSTFYSSPLN